jgi:hypothetical protein
MLPDLTVEATIERRRERLEPIDDRRLRAAVSRGQWRRVTPGAFIQASEWRAMKPLERHRIVVLETMRRMRRPAVVSHFAAAALWGIDVLGDWPAMVDVSRGPAGGGRSSGGIRRHVRATADLEVVPAERHRVTTPAQTALDLARSEPFLHAVAIVDQAITTSRIGGALTTREEIVRLWDAQQGARGSARAHRAISFADPLAANVRESQSRVVIAQLGFPRPRLQERRVLASGRVAFGDIYFPPPYDHWCEVDGRGKYLSPEFRAGRSPDAIVIDEKNRENEIRRIVRGFSRWEATDADDPRRIWDILTGDGLPCSLPRP